MGKVLPASTKHPFSIWFFLVLFYEEEEGYEWIIDMKGYFKYTVAIFEVFDLEKGLIRADKFQEYSDGVTSKEKDVDSF